MLQNKILITGTDGFIGGVLKESLQEKGYAIVGTTYIRDAGEQETHIDIRQPADFQNLPDRDFSVIIHTAGIVDQTVPKKLMFAVNAEGTKNILAWAKQHGCKHFIQLSSVAVYGLRVLGENRSEERTRRTRGWFGIPYMRSKAKAERYIEQSRIPYTILRLPPVLGEQDTYLSPSIIPRLINGSFSFCGKGNKMFSTLYVKNLGPFLLDVIEKGPFNDAFNCTDYTITWREFVGEYAHQLNVNLPNRQQSLGSIIKHWNDKKWVLMITFCRFGAHYPSNKLKAVIGFEPQFPWQDGVRDAIQSYLAMEKK